MYMVPPFIAYYAADKNNENMLHESVKQCGYYRQVLQSDTTAAYKGVWEHIIGPESRDTGLWSTGNGWAAAGMTRVLATVMKAPIAQSATWAPGAINDLTSWIMEILDGAMGSSMDGGLLRNYLNNMDPNNHGFGEISGSSLLAAVVYRMAVLQPDRCSDHYIQWADDIRAVLGGKDANGKLHVTSDGVATPAVNPLNWQDTNPTTTGSPEGQVFVVLMYAAWRDCVLVGRCSKSQSQVSRRKLHKRRYHATYWFSSS
jgi:rhamnogalacturonyl hydrolase YesR